jgi:hypothetical protein
MISCEVISDLMAVCASGEASIETQRLVEEHLSHCSVCRQAFGRDSKAEKIFGELETREKPPNGRFFINRTRRLLFELGAGGLFIFASILALFERVVMRGIARLSLPVLPGADTLWLAVAAFGFFFYTVWLFRMRSKQERMIEPRFFPQLSVVMLIFFIVSLVAYHLLVAGSLWFALIGMAFFLVALIVNFSLLSRLPYLTIGTVLVLILLNFFLLSQAAIGVGRPLLDFTLVPAEELGHPVQGRSVEDPSYIDLNTLGLELVSQKEASEVAGIALGPDDAAVQSLYQGNGQRVYLTFVKMRDKHEASKFYNAWKKKVSTKLRILHVDIIGQLFRSYNVAASRAYNAWKTENWVVILEVPGSFSRAWPLINKVRETVARSFKQDQGRQP